MVIIVIYVRKWQDKNNYEHMANEKTLELSNKDGSSEGATPNQPTTSEGCGYQENRDKWHIFRVFTFLNRFVKQQNML